MESLETAMDSVKGTAVGEPNLKAALGYPKFKEQPRVLVFDTGYLVVGDVIDGATDLGWAVRVIQTKGNGAAHGDFVATLLKAVLLHRPDFIVTVNHLGFDEQGVLAGLLAQYEIPTVSWFVDHPMPILGAAVHNTSAYLQVFTFERTSLPWLSQHGYEDSLFLPTGANRRHFHPSKIDPARRERFACDLSFAGNSWWTKARVEPPMSIRRAAERAAKGMTVDKHVLQNGFEASLEKEIPGRARERYAAAQVMLAEASMQKRRSFARALVPVGIRIHGDPAWSKLAPGVDLHPVVDHEQGLPALFAASKINANVTAEQMPTAVNQRVWDVPAAGGFLLTDHQEDALAFFDEDEEIAVYRSFEEAADKAFFYLRHETKRNTIAKRAMEKVDAQHTVQHRLGDMWNAMKKRFGRV